MVFHPLQRTFVSICGQEVIQTRRYAAEWTRLGLALAWFQPQVSAAFTGLAICLENFIFLNSNTGKQDNCKRVN